MWWKRIPGPGVTLLLLAALAPALPAHSQVPSFREVNGHELGEGITLHHQMIDYLERLAEASPRVQVIDQGRSWEERSLPLAIVTSPSNHARLEEIRLQAGRLADPRSIDAEEAGRIIAGQPAILFLGGSIHGFELSGAEGVLRLLEHLTTRDDPEVLQALEETVILLDPMLNPDGREAFARRNVEMIGRLPNPRRDDWSNDFSRWEALAFRTGHYFFDTNRDWWAQTQRETRARARTLLAWRPQVVVDLHEMGPDVEFYFDPAAEPYGPFFPQFARRWFDEFGKAHAAAFDEAGFEYMTRERYNYFYPGYTTSWGSYQGAVGMLYEQGSSRGLALRRADDSERTLADAMEQQFTAAWAAVRTSAERRQELLDQYFEAQREAVEGKGPRYLIDPTGRRLAAGELVDLLHRNGIEVAILEREARLARVSDREGREVGDRTFSAGTLVVDSAQPRNRLIRALLEPNLPLPDDFLAEARRRVDRGENPRFYDITAWSLPLLFDLPAFSSGDRSTLATAALGSEPTPAPALPESRASYAYVLDGRESASLAALYELKARGFRAAVTLETIRIAGRELSSGSVVLRIGQNEDRLHREVREVAQSFSLDLQTLDTGLSEEGFPALGSSEVIPVRLPRIALLAGDPVHGYSFGWAWYTLDRRYRIPLTIRRADTLASTPLAELDVLVVPDLRSAESLGSLLGEAGLERLRQWVRDGGSMVAIGDGVEFVREQLGLTALRSWYEANRREDPSAAAASEGEGSERRFIEPARFEVPGALLRGELDHQRWLAAGSPGELPILVSSHRIYLEPEGPPEAGRRVVGRFTDGSSLLISGHAWPESLVRLPAAVFAYEERVARGRVILFSEDPNFRAYWRGGERLFLNAVLLAPSAP